VRKPAEAGAPPEEKEISMSTKAMKFLFLLPLLILGLASHADAQLVRGPINPANGFPLWYQDSAGVPTRLQLCLDPVSCEADPPLAGAFSQAIGFGRQAFWWEATADIGRLATIQIGIRTSWVGGVVARGNQLVINFIRIDVRNLPAGGLYVITHPFGVERINVVADPITGRFDINFLRSVRGRPLSANVLAGPVTKFLKAPARAGFIGDPKIARRITGSPRGTNFFRIRAPAGVDIGGNPTPNVITQSLFLVQGQLAP
jgi:hypothetical protein